MRLSLLWLLYYPLMYKVYSKYDQFDGILSSSLKLNTLKLTSVFGKLSWHL